MIRKVAGALGAGCSIIIKPSEETPGTAVAIARCFQDAGLPDGVLNVVFGVPDEVSRQVLGSWIPRKVSFTGSIPVGKHLTKLAADTLKRCTMELGGHSPVIVFDDADLEKALDTLAGFKFRNAGQVCISPTRFYVQDNSYKAFVEGFTARAKALKVGNGLEDGTQMGPLIAERRLDVMAQFVADAKDQGAKVTTGGERIGNQGYFYAPTILADVPDEAKIMIEEPFGPLAPITPFRSFDEVVERFNATLILAGTAFVLCSILGVVAGVLSAANQYGWGDKAITFAVLLGISIPSCFLGMMMILFFAVNLRWFPVSGMWPIYGDRNIGVLITHLTMPALALAVVATGVIARLSRSAMLEVLRQDFIRTARAKGVHERGVIWRHALKAAMVSIIPVLGIQAGFVLSGAVYIEIVFQWPGVGRMLVDAILKRDILLVQGGVVFVAACYVLFNIAVDVAQSLLDPRIKT